MHGGTVDAHSDGPGCGTTVTVRLPVLTSQTAVVEAVPTEPQLPVAPRRILVADDNRDAARSLALQLQLAGHDVRTAFDGVEALALADVFEPEVVLLDLGMPKLDGFETAREMRRRPWGPVATLVALTGWGQPQDRQRTGDAGFDLHLVKPVSAEHLFQAIAGESPGSRSAASGTSAAS